MSEKEIGPFYYNPILQAEREWLWMLAWIKSYGGQIGPLGDGADVTSVAISASVASRVQDDAYRKAALTAAAEYLQRAAEKPASDFGIQSKAA
jgi:hypothetical protein